MSNFFDGYINQLCLDENKSSNLQIAKNVTTSKIGLVKETINKGKTLIKSDMILVPDLDNIDAEIKEKLKSGNIINPDNKIGICPRCSKKGKTIGGTILGAFVGVFVFIKNIIKK